ncbi:MAG: hypothetical protein ABIK09_19425 [Pseudomonadota bacterium]
MKKTVVLVVVAAMLVSFVAAGLVLLFSGKPDVVGTYQAGGDRTLVLDKSGTATLTVEGNPPQTAPYEVTSDAVEIQTTDESGKPLTIPFELVGRDLRSPDGVMWIFKK